MTHTTEIVQYKKLSNGQFSYCVRCCGNQSTDSWHTLDFSGDPAERARALDAARQRVASEHDAAVKAEAEILEQMGKTEEHAL